MLLYQSEKEIILIQMNQITVSANKNKENTKTYYRYQAIIPELFLQLISKDTENYKEKTYYVIENKENIGTDKAYDIITEKPKEYIDYAKIRITNKKAMQFTLPKKIINKLHAYDQYIKFAKEMQDKSVYAPNIKYTLHIYSNKEGIFQYKLYFKIRIILDQKYIKKFVSENELIPAWFNILHEVNFSKENIEYFKKKKIPLEKL